MIDEMTKAGYTEEEAAGVIQETLVANFGSKGKGKGKRSGKSFNTMRKGGGKGAPTLEDRKQRLKEIKARSKCNTCKEMGHWAGDPECKGKPRTAMVAFTGERELPVDDLGAEQYFAPASSVAVSSASHRTPNKM